MEKPMSSSPDMPVPPATFDFLVMSLRAQVEIQLGIMHFGSEEERPQPKLPLARHAIDMLAMLQDKTKGNLSLEEQRLIENTVTELRFLYVQASTRLAATNPPPAAED
jgi:Domain of unknown function (DUF1844)